ncbi:MAG TPA: hypothetical protein VMG59_06395 [Phycisphaerae bacterium]|nr:hypothetical protein [Phycisphaerae bacterium]
MGNVLTGLNGSITLPTGITFKIDGGTLEEDLRQKDAEGFTDNGYQTGVLTGLGLKGTVTGFMTTDDPGIADTDALTKFSNVAFTFTFSGSGKVVTGNCNLTRFRAGMKVGEVTSFTAEFSSTGQYSSTDNGTPSS